MTGTGGALLLQAARRRAFTLFAGAFGVMHLYAALYGMPDTNVFFFVHLTFALVLVFLRQPLRARSAAGQVAAGLVDLALILACLWATAYMVANVNEWELRNAIMMPADWVAGIALVVATFEAVRRSVGWVMIVIACFFCVHALTADHFPGVFYGAPVTTEALMVTILIGQTGLFGVPISVMAQYVVLFILFGELLGACGAGAFITQLAIALFGHRIGGPAKAAVVSSAMMGSVSGSAIGNVLTTGAFTIPLMRRLGYRPEFAGGVEAASSTGGMVMPPVMGAVAFMMADFIGIAYARVALAAALPALLYYFVIYVTVHLEAKRLGLRQLPREELPSAIALLRQNGAMLLPLVAIVAALVADWSIIWVALSGIISTLAVSLLRRETWPTPARLVGVLEATAGGTAGLSATAGCAGIIIAGIFSTGLSFELTQMALRAAGGALWLILVLVALMAFVMGMGMTTSAVYITLVATVVPILKAAGVPDMAAHLFALYYGVVSNITPPVALAAFAAAPLAGASALATGLQASRVGIGAFMVPFLFVYGPALVLEGPLIETVHVAVTAALGLSALAAATTGYLVGPAGLIERVGFAVAAVLLTIPETMTDIAGLVVGSAAVLLNMRAARRRAALPAAAVAAAEAAQAARPAGLFDRLSARIGRDRMAREEGGEALSTESAATASATVAAPRRPPLLPPALRAVLDVALTLAAILALGLFGRAEIHAADPAEWLLGMLGIGVILALVSRPVRNSAGFG